MKFHGDDRTSEYFYRSHTHKQGQDDDEDCDEIRSAETGVHKEKNIFSLVRAYSVSSRI